MHEHMYTPTQTHILLVIVYYYYYYYLFIYLFRSTQSNSYLEDGSKNKVITRIRGKVICAHVCAGACAGRCMGCHSSGMTHLVFKIGSPIGLELTKQERLSAQQAPWIHLPPPSQC